MQNPFKDFSRNCGVACACSVERVCASTKNVVCGFATSSSLIAHAHSVTHAETDSAKTTYSATVCHGVSLTSVLAALQTSRSFMADTACSHCRVSSSISGGNGVSEKSVLNSQGVDT